MITFTIALLVLIGGYFVYGKFVEKVFGIDPSRKNTRLYQTGRGGLHSHADMESIYDPVPEYRGVWARFSEPSWVPKFGTALISVDRFGQYFLPVRFTIFCRV